MSQANDFDVQSKTCLERCDAACESLNPLSPSRNKAATSGETIQTWNQQLRKPDKLQHPNPTAGSGMSLEPNRFERFPESKDA
jgi:hypothetical protein